MVEKEKIKTLNFTIITLLMTLKLSREFKIDCIIVSCNGDSKESSLYGCRIAVGSNFRIQN